MDRTCSRHGGDEKMCTKFWFENLNGTEHLIFLGQLNQDGQKLTANATRMSEMGNIYLHPKYRSRSENLKGEEHLGNLAVDGKTI
jgi:hypothetical protein